MMRKIFIWPNLTKEKYTEPVKRVVQALERRRFTCLVSAETAARVFPGEARRAALPEEADLILSVGGDGTFLRAAADAIACKKPLCGYNAGRLGYLCALRESVLAYFSPERLVFFDAPVLCCRMRETPEAEEKEYYALSDIVIGKDYFGGTVVPAWKINGGREHRCISDGLILSTPIGSTGYTRSAGGPELPLHSQQFAVTPICPHSGSGKAGVFENTGVVRVYNADPAYSASVYADGRRIGALCSAEITKAPFTLPVALRWE